MDCGQPASRIVIDQEASRPPAAPVAREGPVGNSCLTLLPCSSHSFTLSSITDSVKSTILELNFPLTSVSTLSTDHCWNVEQVDPLRLSVSHLAGSAFCKVCIQATLELLQVHTLLTVGANSVGPLPAGAKSASIFPISTNSTQILPGGKNKSYILPGGTNGTPTLQRGVFCEAGMGKKARWPVKLRET